MQSLDTKREARLVLAAAKKQLRCAKGPALLWGSTSRAGHSCSKTRAVQGTVGSTQVGTCMLSPPRGTAVQGGAGASPWFLSFPKSVHGLPVPAAHSTGTEAEQPALFWKQQTLPLAFSAASSQRVGGGTACESPCFWLGYRRTEKKAALGVRECTAVGFRARFVQQSP